MNPLRFFFILCFIVIASACTPEEVVIDPVDEPEVEIDIDVPDWTEATHSNDVEPNYETVFPDDEVLRIDITIAASDWTAMQANLSANIGGGGGPGGGGVDFDFTPIWVPCALVFNGVEWYKVGIRYKGNSSLRSAFQSSGDKYPFKLDFDEFEDTYPAIKNQRFYGFKQLNLSNNHQDASFLREKVAADLFREFGVPAARTTFCAVYLDRGNGSSFIGLYTLVEEVDDSVPESQFSNPDGNLYKPDGTGATFASGTYNEAEMDLKTNEEEADYSDVRSLYDMLHSTERTSNEAQWKTSLEGILDIEQYLKYLAANNVIQNWDTYGIMTHNYFLYNLDGKLVWIPWDNNEAFQHGKMGGALSLGMSEVGNNWPLIRYVMDVEEYEEQYKLYVRQFADEVFEPVKMQALYSTYEGVISGYASQENGGVSSAISSLKSHVESRKTAVDDYLE
ncbi:MAG: CotH kinase family protein [Bacteroidota bacterium]